MTDHIEYFWQPSPQLWMAMRDNYCGCGECSRGGYGLGRTKGRSGGRPDREGRRAGMNPADWIKDREADKARARRMPRALDLFCCGGGASRGLARAGFAVTGVDIEPQPGYPFAFILGDALEADLTGYDFIWASPPCQGYSGHVSSRSSKWVPHAGKDEPRLIEPVRAMLEASGVPYVIENVRGAMDELRSPVMLCGSMFGLPIARHRFFEMNWSALSPRHPKCKGIAKDFAARKGWEYRDMSVTGKGRHAGTADRWKEIMGIEPEARMTQHQLAEAVPPAYAAFIARSWMALRQVMEEESLAV